MISKDETFNKNRINIFSGIITWLLIQGILSLNHVYSQDFAWMPPKIFLFGIIPNILLGIWLFSSRLGKRFIDHLPLEKLTYLNLVRIPVELVLLWLYINKAIPKLLTFEGLNFDIVMGLTAPFIIYFGFIKNQLSNKVILIWNIIGFLLLIFVFLLAILSSPFPLQQFAFDQPNIGLLHFPFTWLPTFIVPVVLLGHLISIRQLLKK